MQAADDAPPVDGRYVPAAQPEQAVYEVAPTAVENVPAGQPVQLGAAAMSEYEPAGQATQASNPPPANCPMMQLPRGAVAPGKLVYCPGGLGQHAAAPRESIYNPGAQAEHAEEPAEELVPLAQAPAGAVRPVVSQ